MKKFIYLFIAVVALHAHLVANQINRKQSNKEVTTTFSKSDYAKISVAALGALFFSAACIGAYPTANWMIDNIADENAKTSRLALPALFCAVPFWLLTSPLLDDEQLLIKVACGLSGITSGALAILLGTYVYKKLAQLKAKNMLE